MLKRRFHNGNDNSYFAGDDDDNDVDVDDEYYT